MKRFWARKEGQTLVIYALFMVALMGMSALAIDVGYLYSIRTSLQRAADAAVLAGASGFEVDTAEASSRANNFATQNLTGNLATATVAVNFPTTTSIQVTVSDPTVNLFFGGVVGISSAVVSAVASASLDPITVLPDAPVPLAIYCNDDDAGEDCNDNLSVGDTYTVRRYCGNFFQAGANGNSCGNPIADDEVFFQGVTFTQASDSNAVFRNEVYNGFEEFAIAIGDVVGALRGNRNGWQGGMENRLAEGRDEMTLLGVRPIGNGLELEVYDFIRVRITNFQRQGNTDTTTFEIIRFVTDTTEFRTNGGGYGVNSVGAVRLSQ